MPRIKPERVCSFSSEDPVHVADNILNTDTNKKWKCKEVGEKRVTVVIQLREPTKITAIDIGNEHSAFVEVHVGRSTFQNAEFKILLLMSSFMTPMDSRQSHNKNRIRMFTENDLVKPICNERWDQVMFVCTQPFNRHVQYGLSFVTLHTNAPETPSTPTSTCTNAKTVGRFKLRDESAENEFSPGSIFSKRKESSSQENGLSVAAAIRRASLPSSSGKNDSSEASSSRQASTSDSRNKRNRQDLMYEEDDDKAIPKIDKVINQHKHSQSKNETRSKTETPSSSKKVKSESSRSNKNGLNSTCSTPSSESTASSSRIDAPAANTPILDNGKRQRIIKTRPFRELLKGVFFVISGYQNPLRADIRNKALEMGAKYKPDWGTQCTHLICAFKNTPKYNEVRHHGKIVVSDWIFECYNKKKRIPWRAFALDSKDKLQSESEEEIVDESTLVTSSEERVNVTNSTRKSNGSSNSDTEDEIESVRAKIAKKNAANLPSSVADDISDRISLANIDNVSTTEVDTDTETLEAPEIDRNKKLDSLPEYFSNIKFFISQNFDTDQVDMLNRYIIAPGGEIVDCPSKAQYLITEDLDEMEDCRRKAPSVLAIRPAWIWECNDMEKLVKTNCFKL